MSPADPCYLLTGSLQQACESVNNTVNGGSGGGGSSPGSGGASTASILTDPVGAIASDCAQAAASVIKAVSDVVTGTTTINFTNSGFLTQYAVVFAASAVLTLVLWLAAVIKRAVRGESIVTSIAEATGFLWLAVIASAFTPVVLYGMVSLTDSVTNAIGAGTSSNTNNFLTSFANSLDPPSGQSSDLGGGPILLIFISIVALIAAAVLWLELLIRAAMLYVGAALATAVYAGLVDKALWRHVRRWAGMMIAVDLAKPVIVIVLGLATAISGNPTQSSVGSVLSGLAIMLMSIFSSGLIFRFVPNFGDDVLALGAARGDGGGEAPAGAMNSPASTMQAGIAAHAGRSGSIGGGMSGNPLAGPAVAAIGMGAGLAAHGARAAVKLTASRTQPGVNAPPGQPPLPPGGPPNQPPRDGTDRTGGGRGGGGQPDGSNPVLGGGARGDTR